MKIDFDPRKGARNAIKHGVTLDGVAIDLSKANVPTYFASAAEVAAAVAVAKAAFPAWRATNLSRRAEVMFHLRELVDANRKEIATLLTKEHGKVLGDALGDTLRAYVEKREQERLDDAPYVRPGRAA